MSFTWLWLTTSGLYQAWPYLSDWYANDECCDKLWWKPGVIHTHWSRHSNEYTALQLVWIYDGPDLLVSWHTHRWVDHAWNKPEVVSIRAEYTCISNAVYSLFVSETTARYGTVLGCKTLLTLQWHRNTVSAWLHRTARIIWCKKA